MNVILLERIGHLGDLGDEIRVKPGYARNYLFPRGKAVPATVENREKFESRRAELKKAAEDALEKARTRAATLDGLAVQIARKAGEDGKLFGSVNTADIAEAVVAAGQSLAKSEIHLPEGPIKAVGDYDVSVTLHPTVDVTVKVSVLGES